MLSPEQLSDLIGMIYDCAIGPERWPETLAAICRAIRCLSGAILLIDLNESRYEFAYTSRVSPDWTARYLGLSKDLTGFYTRAFSRQNRLDGEPLIMSEIVPQTGPPGQHVFALLTRPHGISDAMQTVVLRERRRIAIVSVHRHDNAAFRSEDVKLMRLLAPHIQRAVKIIDILDMTKVEAQTLAATLDNLTAGIIVVGDHGRILHANDSAKRMLSAREPIAAIDGFLSVRNAKANNALSDAIALARSDEAAIGPSGIGVPLGSADPAVAHVLPLAHGDLRTRLVPDATAAVFITQAENAVLRDISALARHFALTPSETRLLQQLAGNATLADARDALGISSETARTHLAHIFSKTGVSRQAELLSLIDRLVPPIRQPRH